MQYGRRPPHRLGRGLPQCRLERAHPVGGLYFNHTIVSCGTNARLADFIALSSVQIMHITFLGLDNARELVYRHCRQMLLNLMIVLGDHGDHLTVSSILMNSKTDAREFGLSLPPLPNVLIRYVEYRARQI